jgi:hypothetical protein
MAGDWDANALIHQDVSPGGDAYVAARDMHVHHVHVTLQGQAAPLAAPALLSPEPAELPGRSRASRLLRDAVRAAFMLDDDGRSKAAALADVTGAAVVAAPECVAWLAAEAEAFARAVKWEPERSYSLAYVACAMAAIDPERAETVARWVDPVNGEQSTVLAMVAPAVAVADPERALALARSIPDVQQRLGALAGIARAITMASPERAAWLATEIEVAAHSLKGTRWESAAALTSLAQALVAVDPERAEAVARSIEDRDSRLRVLADIARTVALTDQQWATRLAADVEAAIRSVKDPTWRARLLADVAEAVAAADPERLARLAADVEAAIRSARDKIPQQDVQPYSQRFFALLDLQNALGDVARAVAMVDPERAEAIARSTGSGHSEWALQCAARAMAAVDPERAEAVARSIEDEWFRISALAGIALLLGRKELVIQHTPRAAAQAGYA